MTKTYTLSVKQAAEGLAVTTQEVNKLAQKGQLTRIRKNPEKDRSPWLYSEQEIFGVQEECDCTPGCCAEYIEPAIENEVQGETKPWWKFWR